MESSIRFLASALVVVALLTATSPEGWSQIQRTYTTDADFDEGVLVNVNHNAPNNNQLQLNVGTAAFGFVNVAASQRGTVVRIDVNTGEVVGEFFSAPNGRGRDPSRTTVDRNGNVWVGNRGESSFSMGAARGSVTRIGLIIGGTRVDAASNPDPNGEYLMGPFDHNTCEDRDGDGLIRTSTGLANILPWPNTGNADSDGGVSTAVDECIINYTRTFGTAVRTVAIDANNDVWVGGTNMNHEKVDGVTGMPVAGTQFNLGCGGYGGFIDGAGVLWTARYGAGLLRYDTNTQTGACLGNLNGDYGLGLDPVTGEVWHTALSGNRVCKLNPDGTLVGCFQHGNSSAQGVTVDGNGSVWVAHSLFSATTVGHVLTDGTHVGNVALPGGSGPTGVAVDANGKVWVANINSNNAMRIDPAGGALGGGGVPIGEVDLTVSLGAGAAPYNYSDMTGAIAVGTAPEGTWTVIFNGGKADIDWGQISWMSVEPPGTEITAEIRAANTQADLLTVSYSSVADGEDFSGSGHLGQFIQIRVTLRRDAQVQDSPILQALTIMAEDEAPTDTTPPSCRIVSINRENGQAVSVSIEVQDHESGISTVQVMTARNARLEIPAGSGNWFEQGETAEFDPPTTELVEILGAKIDVAAGASIVIRVTDDAGNSTVCDPVIATLSAEVPEGFDLGPNYPNPFNPATLITFQVKEASFVTMKVFDITGREVATLVNETLEPGTYSVDWDGTDARGEKVAGGVYVYQMRAATYTSSRTMVLLK